jgi:hypothetical protein
MIVSKDAVKLAENAVRIMEAAGGPAAKTCRAALNAAKKREEQK